MSLKKANIVTSFLLFGLAVFVMFEATRLPVVALDVGLKPGVLPFWLAVGLAVLSLILIIQSLRAPQKSPQKEKIWGSFEEIIGVGAMFLALALYAGLMEYLGFGTATVLVVAFLSRRLGKYQWWKCVLLGLIVAVLSVEVFRRLLTLSLPTGLIGF